MNKFLDEFGLAHVWTNIKNYIDSKIFSDGGEEVYSTEEVRIGTWIDGKPLYRKTIVGAFEHASSTQLEVYPVVTGLNVIDVKGYVDNSGYSFSSRIYLTWYQDDDLLVNPYYDRDTLTFSIVVRGKLYGTYNYICTIEYTKTTD